MQWFAQAPSNIALIKYMGKKNEETNTPVNASLSYTLNNLISSVVLESHPGKNDFWEQLNIPGARAFSLSAAAQQRYLNHLAMLKKHFKYSGAFIVRSCNNFPHSSGLASSASSFAALTKCAVLALSELTEKKTPSITAQAKLSQQGSGSSCRSFFSPWALWEEKTVKSLKLPYDNLLHQVIVISHMEKEVSSSEAHVRVSSSPLYASRHARAESNLQQLLSAIKSQDWTNMYKICWHEFQDMHALFTTSNPAFSYITEPCTAALNTLQNMWDKEGDGPIITMDAGPNIHLLYRPEQTELAQRFKHDHLVGNYDVL